jgi:hypothetical protein
VWSAREGTRSAERKNVRRTEATSDIIRLVPSFHKTPIADTITQHALLIMADDGRRVRASGSAVFVAPELAITAKHVIEDFWNALLPGDKPENGLPVRCEFRVHAVQFPGDTIVPAVWRLTRAWCSSFTDVAFLELRPANGAAQTFAWVSTLGLSLLPPAPGETILGFGYPDSAAEFDRTIDIPTIAIGINGRSTIGEVLCVYPAFRDRGMLTFPCFETNARFDGGMSGGPIFNERGLLCGLICASHGADDPHGHISWGATLWPAMVTEIEFQGLGVTSNGLYSAFHLLNADVIHSSDNWESIGRRIVFRRHDNGRGYLVLENMPLGETGA